MGVCDVRLQFVLLPIFFIVLMMGSAYSTRVIEVDENGRIIWEISRGPYPIDPENFSIDAIFVDADRMPNGNTLIVRRFNAIYEYNISKQLVRNIFIDDMAIHDAEYLHNGNILVTGSLLVSGIRDTALVREYCADGNIRYEFRTGDWWNNDIEKLPNGGLLIANADVVIEYDENLVPVWDSGVIPYVNFVTAKRLENGNTLIVDRGYEHRVMEMAPNRTIVWQFGEAWGIGNWGTGKRINPLDAERLPNGNTLIADHFRRSVIEVTQEGDIVKEIENLDSPVDIDYLSNGNLLITVTNIPEIPPLIVISLIGLFLFTKKH